MPIVLSFCLFTVSFAQQKIYDENGNWYGLYNMNPDPDGEPWIAGGLKPPTAEEIAAYERLPELVLSEEHANRSLPKTVDNSTAPQFRNIFNQIGGSCGQASGMGYHFTYERNLVLGTLPTDKSNICSYGFAWNFVNGGSGTGSWPSAGYAIAAEMGCGHVRDFNNTDNGGSQTAWMNGYTGYYNANDCHVVKQVKFNSSDVNKLKNWFYDKGKGTGKNGGCVTFGSNVQFKISTIQSGPFAGQKVCTYLPNGSAHAMTLAGYSDEISYDVNGDGVITNDIDITRDGIVDYRDRESGAYQLVNSWGTSWHNRGKVWVLYSGFNAQQIVGIEVEKFTTQLMIKAKVTSSRRNTIVAKTGYATDLNASSPKETKGYGKAFNQAGGSHPMGGKGESSTLTFGLDCSEFVPKLPNGKGVIFLQISGTGTVNELSVMDYTSGGQTPKETKYEKTNISINGTMNLGIKVEIGTTPIEKSMMTSTVEPARAIIKKVGSEYSLYVPNTEIYSVSITNIQGRLIQSFTTNQQTVDYSISKHLVPGTYIVSASSTKSSLVEKIEIVR